MVRGAIARRRFVLLRLEIYRSSLRSQRRTDLFTIKIFIAKFAVLFNWAGLETSFHGF